MTRLELTLNFPKNFHVKTFNVKCEKKLSPLTKLILKSIRFKHFYYARDDISYLLRSKPIEREFLLQALYSIVIVLQNNFCTNFFDMWIYDVYINKIPNFNKFINQKLKNRESGQYLTIKLAYAIHFYNEKI